MARDTKRCHCSSFPGKVFGAGDIVVNIVPLSLFYDVLILCALGAALASPRMSTLARPVVATFAFLCAWLATAAFDAMRAPLWTIFLGVALMVVGLVVIAITLHAWTQQNDDGEGGAGDDGPGGPGWAPPVSPRGGGSGVSAQRATRRGPQACPQCSRAARGRSRRKTARPRARAPRSPSRDRCLPARPVRAILPRPRGQHRACGRLRRGRRKRVASARASC